MLDPDRKKDHKPEEGSLVDKHGFDNVMRGFLAVKPKGDEERKGKKQPAPKQKARASLRSTRFLFLGQQRPTPV